jgi:hypothetical protein
MRNLVISLGITTLSSFLLYMYFKNRMSDVENKVDIMFQLIQEHTAANEAATKAAAALHSVNFQAPNMQVIEQETSSNNLVDVSDDDMGGSSSEEVSDSEDEDEDDADSIVPRLDVSDIKNLKDNIFAEETDNTIKKINLNIQGSETSVDEEKDLVLDNLEDLNLDSNKDHSNDEQDEELELEEVDTNNLEIGEPTVNLTLITEDVVVHKSQSVNDEENNDDEDDNVDEDLSKITLEENEMDSVKTIKVNEITNLDENELRKKTVAQLKDIAAQKNLQKYKSLTKKRLIDLISNSH